MHTTLNQIRLHAPGSRNWEILLTALGKTEPDNDPIPISQILDTIGFDYALWCLHAVKEHDKEIWMYAVRRARQSIHLQSKHYVNDYWKQVEKFVKSNISKDELRKAFILAFSENEISRFFSAAGCANVAVNWALYEIGNDAARKVSRETAWQCAWGLYPDWDNVHVSRREAEHSARKNELKTQEHYLRLLFIGQEE